MGLLDSVTRGLLENPNFSKWFGKSTAKDAKGLPLEVFHGTTKDFEHFIPGGTDWSARTGNTLGEGIYFTTEPGQAAAYARGEGGRTIPGFLSGNFADFDNLTPEQITQIESAVGKLAQTNGDAKMAFDLGKRTRFPVDDIEEGRQFFKDRQEDWKYFDGYKDRNKPEIIKEGEKLFVEYNDPNQPGVFSFGDNSRTGFDRLLSYFGGDTSNVLKEAGFDGHRLGQVFVAYEPTSFKSRFNQGTFDPTDPNFLKSAAALTAAGAVQGLLSPDKADAAYPPNFKSKQEAAEKTAAEDTWLNPVDMAQAALMAPGAIGGKVVAGLLDPPAQYAMQKISEKLGGLLRSTYKDYPEYQEGYGY